MKPVILFSLLAITAYGLVGCGNANPDAVLNTKEGRDQVFSAIVNDHEMMMEFMGKMMDNDHAKNMMMGNKNMMNMMMGNKDMMNMMMGNKDMMNMMMGKMMSNGGMMNQMMKKMVENGYMSEECHAQCMAMMKDKGMDMGQMNMNSSTDMGNDTDHESHHQ